MEGTRNERVKISRLHFIEAEKIQKEGLPLEEIRLLYQTMKGTGLYVQTPKETLPVADAAMKSLQGLLGIRGRALKKLKTADVRMILNKCTALSGKTAVMQISEGQIIGFQKSEKEGEKQKCAI